MKHGSLFSGIGGFDLAADLMGWENIFHCEWNDFGQKILKYYWPNADSLTDITKTDFTKYADRIDILTGGFPCQPYSQAGKRLGKEDDRHLWPEMLRAIREIQPRWVVGENVLGLVNWSGGLVFHEVQADLEAEGYEVFPYVLPACAVNAPHRRDRVWFVAYAGSLRHRGGSKQSGSDTQNEREIYTEIEQHGDNIWSKTERRSSVTPNSYGSGFQKTRTEQQTAGASGSGLQETTPNTNGRRQSGKEYGKTEPGQLTKESFSNYWQNFPTQSPVCSGNDGISARLDKITFSKWRNESIKAAGNAIVPQVALQIFKTIKEYEIRIQNTARVRPMVP